MPGKLSEKLRKALDLRKNECPAHIYRMRTFGYPPGWLQEAMTSEDNTLELFDFQGCAVENGKEDANKALDLAKVIDYPGFNVPLEKGMKDVCFIFNFILIKIPRVSSFLHLLM